MTFRDKYSLNKNFVLHVKLDSEIPLVPALESAWRLLLGRGWAFCRQSGNLPADLREGGLGIVMTEGTDDESDRSGIGYQGFHDSGEMARFWGKRQNQWVVQPSELTEHPAFCANRLDCSLVMTWGSDLKFAFGFDYERGLQAGSASPLTTRRWSGWLEGHCFYPHALKPEEYTVALEAYEVLKSLSILWQVSECYGQAYLDEEHPESMIGRQFQFGFKRPNRLITFFEERRMPNAEELSDDLYAVESGFPLARWLVEVPQGEHFLPSDLERERKLEAILAYGKRADFT